MTQNQTADTAASASATAEMDEVRPRASVTMDETEQTQTVMERGSLPGLEAGVNAGGQEERRLEEKESMPSWLLDCRDAVEACSHRAQAWADEQNEKAERKQAQRRERADGGVRIEQDGTVVEPKGEKFLQRKAIVFLVFVILTWVLIVYVWRIGANGIRQTRHATASRQEAIGFLVVFCVLWLWTMWSYVKVIVTGPGYVRDEFPVVDPPKSPKIAAQQPAAYPSVEPINGEVATHTDAIPQHAPTPFAPYPVPAVKEQGSSVEELGEKGEGSHVVPEGLPGSGSVDSKLAAALGPIGVSMLARADEASIPQDIGVSPPNVVSQPLQPPPPTAQPLSSLPEPLRLPQTSFPLHEINTYCYRCKRIKPPRSHHCRHCGTCVLKMDHHCPWVGGCVGARNHKFFYNFLQSVTVLETFVLITNAILFHRGVQRLRQSQGWSVDGYMISLFPIAGLFWLFTFTLLITHTYLFVMNLSTIEHMSYDRQKIRENILIERWSEERARLDDKPKPGFFAQMRERDAMKRAWSAYWGKPKTEANLWWIDGRRAPRLMASGGELIDGEGVHTPRMGKGERTEDVIRPLSWYHGIAHNWRQAMGDSPLAWFLPVGRGLNADGVRYPANWRFGALGEWTPREQWPSRLAQASPE